MIRVPKEASLRFMFIAYAKRIEHKTLTGSLKALINKRPQPPQSGLASRSTYKICNLSVEK